MGIMSGARELGMWQGLGDSLIEKAKYEQDFTNEFKAKMDREAKEAAAELSSNKKLDQEYRDRGAVFLTREPIKNIVANIASKTNGLVNININDPGLQKQLGRRLVIDGKNGVANPEQSLILSFRRNVSSAAKKGSDVFANIYEKKVDDQPGEVTPEDRQTDTLLSKAVGMFAPTAAGKKKREQIYSSIDPKVRERMEARKRGEPIDPEFKPVLEGKVASDISGQRRVKNEVLQLIANADPNYKYAQSDVPGGPGRIVESEKSPKVGVISEANGLRALADSVIAGGIYDENRPDQVYQDIKILSRVAIESSMTIEDGTPQEKYNQATQSLVDKLMAMKDVDKIAYIERQKALIRDGKIEVLTPASMSSKVTQDASFRSSITKKGVDISTDEKFKEFIEKSIQHPKIPKILTHDIIEDDGTVTRYYFEYNLRTNKIDNFKVYKFDEEDLEKGKGIGTKGLPSARLRSGAVIPPNAIDITQEENKSLVPTNQISDEPSVMIKQLTEDDTFAKLLGGN